MRTPEDLMLAAALVVHKLEADNALLHTQLAEAQWLLRQLLYSRSALGQTVNDELAARGLEPIEDRLRYHLKP